MKTTSKQNLALALSIALAFTLPSLIEVVSDFVHRQYVKMVLARQETMLNY